jgi:hypothetical protein
MASILGKFFGRTISEGAAFAAGLATAPTLGPGLRELENTTRAEFPFYPLDPGTAAAIVAEDVANLPWGEQEALYNGVSNDRFEKLYGEQLNAPDLGTLYAAWRRGLISDGDFVHGLRKAKLEGRWDGALAAMRNVLLSPSDLAMARQQGFVDDARQLADSEKQGVSADNATILFELAGLPPGAAEAQSLLNRGLIDDALFAQIIREGHTKTKYTDLLRRAAVYVLSPINYVEGRLRGWLTDAEMYAGTSLHGVTKADTDLLFKIHGRPISFRQAFIGVRRGGSLDGPTGDIDPAFLAALRRSSIQPSFYNLAWAQRYTYPSAFVLRSLTQSGDITQARAEEVLLFEGWEPGFAKQVAAAWAGGGGTTADPLLRSARTALVSALHKAFVLGDEDETAARSLLAAEAVPAATIDTLIATWTRERSITRKELTPTQLKKALGEGITNPATGAPFTVDEVIAELVVRGYSSNDARVFIET